MGRFTWLILVCVMLSAAAAPPAVTAGGCSSREVVYPVRAVSIRDEAGHAGRQVRYTVPGEQLNIISSTRQGHYCWLQVNEGWLLDSPWYLSSSRSGEVPTQPACFQGATAYITGGMNIRAAASTSSAVEAKARAGDTFAVLESRSGSRWCWLRISPGWLAKTARVQSTRPVRRVVSGPVEPQPVQRSNINNCCFVDRQCMTEDEWTAGYRAYQRNECRVSTVPAQQSGSLPKTTGTDSDVNNCCNLGWNCKTDHEWERGFWNFQVGQCEHPGVIVEGPGAFIARITAILRLLRDRVPHWYSYVLEVLTKIEPKSDTYVTVWFDSGHVKWGIDGWTYRQANMPALASIMVHEACHVHRRRSGQKAGGVEGELACTKIELDALNELDPGNRWGNTLRHRIENIHDPAVQWWN